MQQLPSLPLHPSPAFLVVSSSQGLPADAREPPVHPCPARLSHWNRSSRRERSSLGFTATFTVQRTRLSGVGLFEFTLSERRDNSGRLKTISSTRFRVCMLSINHPRPGPTRGAHRSLQTAAIVSPHQYNFWGSQRRRQRVKSLEIRLCP